MDRSTIWTGSIPRDYDLLKGWLRTARAFGFQQLDFLGGSTHDPAAVSGVGTGRTQISGLPSWATANSASGSVSPMNNAGVTANVAAISEGAVLAGFTPNGNTSSLVFGVDIGTAYTLAAIDATGNIMLNNGSVTAYGDLPAGGGDFTSPDAQQVVIASTIASGTATFLAPNYPGQSNWYLIAVQPQQTDTSDVDDPNLQGGPEAILPYYNSANPSSPLYGLSGLGGRQPTVRSTWGSLLFSTASLTTGSATAPLATLYPGGASGGLPATCIPLYLVRVPYGATGFGSTPGTTATYWVVGRGSAPALGSTWNHAAPVLCGQLEQHHTGNPGSAPQIDGGIEWLPLSAVSNNGQQLTTVAHTATAITGSAHGNSPVLIQSALIPINLGTTWTPGGTPTSNIPSGVTVAFGTPGYSYVLPVAGAMAKLFLYVNVVFTNTNSSGTPLVQGDFAGLVTAALPVTFANAVMSIVGSCGGYGLSSAAGTFVAQGGFTLQVAAAGNAQAVNTVTHIDFAVSVTNSTTDIPATSGTLTVPVCIEITGY